MAGDSESDDPGGGEDGAADRPQDPFVEHVRPDPSQPPEPTSTLVGLLGDSDRPKFRRLYFTTALDFYAEFREDDVLTLSAIPPDQPPFLGEQATRVTLKGDAHVDFTQSGRAPSVDEFDLDVRLAPRLGPGVAPGDQVTFGAPGCFETFGFGCGETGTIITFTCETNCAGQTCDFTCQTCRTICGGATCGPTCLTCRTACGVRTCGPTCLTCRIRCFDTIRGPCVTRICDIQQ